MSVPQCCRFEGVGTCINEAAALASLPQGASSSAPVPSGNDPFGGGPLGSATQVAVFTRLQGQQGQQQGRQVTGMELPKGSGLQLVWGPQVVSPQAAEATVEAADVACAGGPAGVPGSAGRDEAMAGVAPSDAEALQAGSAALAGAKRGRSASVEG